MTDASRRAALDEDGINAAVEALAAFAAAGTLAGFRPLARRRRLAPDPGQPARGTLDKADKPTPAGSWAALAGASPRL